MQESKVKKKKRVPLKLTGASLGKTSVFKTTEEKLIKRKSFRPLGAQREYTKSGRSGSFLNKK